MASNFLIGRVGVLFLGLTTAFTTVSGCSKRDEETKAKAEQAEEQAKKKKKRKKEKPQGDRYADGKRLSNALGDWSKRWSETPELPACDPLLKAAADRQACKTAATALVSLKAAVAKPETESALMHSAAELAIATEEASAKLRLAAMEKTQAAAAKGTPSGGPPGAKAPTPKPVKLVPSALAKDKLQAVGSADPHAPAAPEDPALAVMQAYSRVGRISLRYLSQFLQFGPLPTRKAAFAEAQALSTKKEAWPALGRTVREAAMAENDPELQAQLKELGPKLSRRPPAADASSLPAPSAAASASASASAPAPAPKLRPAPATPAAAPAPAPAPQPATSAK